MPCFGEGRKRCVVCEGAGVWDLTKNYSASKCFNEAKACEDDKNYEDVAFWYRKAADKGSAEAQNNLGVCYAKGKGVARDYTQALYWFRTAAAQDNHLAQSNTGNFYRCGNGVEQSWAEAVKWYKRAADGGDATGQFWMGYVYYYGYEVAKNDERAQYWLLKALANETDPPLDDLDRSSANVILERISKGASPVK